MLKINFKAQNLRVSVSKGTSILDGARKIGIDIISPCGGRGLCGKCRVNIFTEDNNFSESVLACQSFIEKDTTIEIHPSNLFKINTASFDSTLDNNFVLSKRVFDHANIDDPILGLAIDLGTTKIAGYLVDLKTGTTLNAAGILNPQIPYGDDIISRLNYARVKPENADLLHRKIIEAIDLIINELCRNSLSFTNQNIHELVVVANTAMHHLLLKAGIAKLLKAPFTPSIKQEFIIKASFIAIKNAPAAFIKIPPPVCGFIGSDQVAMLLATGVYNSIEPVLAIDIGTNTEISLVVNRKILSASCASGGAFEGTHISCGSRAIKGAIDHFYIKNSSIEFHTIDNALPIGVCGSGLFDIMAQFVSNGIIDKNGRLQFVHPKVREGKSGREFVIVDKGDDVLSITITQDDIRSLQLAKAAISSGIAILLREAGLAMTEIHRVVVAGAFGSYMDITSAIKIGILPDLPIDKYHQVGNAAGIGAKSILISKEASDLMRKISESIHHVELVQAHDFQKIYLSSLLMS